MDTYGLIGFPLKHSFSAKFFTDKFEREKIDAEYLNFELEDIGDIREVLLQNPQLKGLNVTIPYKERIFPFLDEVSPEARKIGAVNVIKVYRQHANSKHYRLSGFNTDYIGFRQSLLPLINSDFHKNALILGTGGASKAVAQVLTDMQIEWRLVSRTPGKDKLTYGDLSPEVMAGHGIIVNASPVGTFPHTNGCPDIPYDLLSPHHLLYDLVYNPEVTLFLQKGKEQGTVIKNGREMLELQALAAWDIWKK